MTLILRGFLVFNINFYSLFVDSKYKYCILEINKQLKHYCNQLFFKLNQNCVDSSLNKMKTYDACGEIVYDSPFQPLTEIKNNFMNTTLSITWITFKFNSRQQHHSTIRSNCLKVHV